MVLLPTERMVAARGGDDDRATVALPCSGGQCFAAVFPVCTVAQVPALSFDGVLPSHGGSAIVSSADGSGMAEVPGGKARFFFSSVQRP